MPNGLKHAAALFLSFVAVTTTVADSTAPEKPPVPPCEKRQTGITYVNGVWNASEVDAFESALQLSMALGTAKVGDYNIDFIYGGYLGKFDDAIQAAAYINSAKSLLQFLDAVAGEGNVLPQMLLGASDIPSLLSTGLAGLRPTIDAIKSQMLESISLNIPKVYVCHSRGSLACNTAYRELAEKETPGLRNVAVLNVASPDSKKIDNANWDYVTFRSDEIIGNIPGSLEANVGKHYPGENGAMPGLAHEFATYLQHSYVDRAGDVINDDIGATLIEKVKALKAAVEAESFPCNATSGTALQ